jgi:hypothetical protein
MESWNGETADSFQYVDANAFESNERIPRIGVKDAPLLRPSSNLCRQTINKMEFDKTHTYGVR